MRLLSFQHLSRQPSPKKRKDEVERASSQCFICTQMGHAFLRELWTRSSQEEEENTLCWKRYHCSSTATQHRPHSAHARHTRTSAFRRKECCLRSCPRGIYARYIYVPVSSASMYWVSYDSKPKSGEVLPLQARGCPYCAVCCQHCEELANWVSQSV